MEAWQTMMERKMHAINMTAGTSTSAATGDDSTDTAEATADTSTHTDITRIQSLTLHHDQQLLQHRDWIAKNAREVSAVREWCKMVQQTGVGSVSGSQNSEKGNARR